MISEYLEPKVLIPTITSILSGVWILTNYLIKRAFYPKIGIEIGMRELTGPDSTGKSAALLIIKIQNSGERRLYIDNAEYNIRCLPDGLDLSSKLISGISEVIFPQEIASNMNLFPPKWEYSWVDSGTSSEYSFTVLIPPLTGVLCVKTKVWLREKRSDFIMASSFFSLEESGKIKKIKIET